jgi:hypothetical protein
MHPGSFKSKDNVVQAVEKASLKPTLKDDSGRAFPLGVYSGYTDFAADQQIGTLRLLNY